MASVGIPLAGIRIGFVVYDPERHRRRTLRLKGYDYSREGAYFVTLCTFERECSFQRFPELKEIVDRAWLRIPERFTQVTLDDYVIMPNHLHGIIVIGKDETRSGEDSKWPQVVSPHETKRKSTLGAVIGTFKSLSSNAWLKLVKTNDINARGRFWQSNYYEHVIRSEGELNRIRTYIADNLLKWESDRENPEPVGLPSAKAEEWMV